MAEGTSLLIWWRYPVVPVEDGASCLVLLKNGEVVSPMIYERGDASWGNDYGTVYHEQVEAWALLPTGEEVRAALQEERHS